MTGEMAEAAFLIETGWTWQAYLDTPDQIVQNMFMLMNARAEYQKSQVTD